MCIACIEYTKQKLTVGEFKSALRETTAEDEKHRKEVAKLLEQYSSDPDELKKQLEKLNQP